MKQVFLGRGRHARTQTLPDARKLLQVKEAFREKGEEVKDDFLVDSSAPRICCIPVKEGVRWWNLLAIPLVPCVIMLVTTYVNAQTILLLRDEDYFNVDEDRLGWVSSTLVLVGFPGAIVGTLSAGYLFDVVGRRLTLFAAFAMGSLLVAAIPHTAPDVVPWLLIVRILIMFSFSAPASNPLLADYVHKDAIGKAAALVGLGFVIGEVLSMGILFNVTSSLDAGWAFLTVAGVGLGFSSAFLCLVKEPQLRQKSTVTDTSELAPQQELEAKVASLTKKVSTATFGDLSAGFEVRNEKPLLEAEESKTDDSVSITPTANSNEEVKKRTQAYQDDIVQSNFTEEEFKKLPCCSKLGHINR